jgi:hypothetical protein
MGHWWPRLPDPLPVILGKPGQFRAKVIKQGRFSMAYPAHLFMRELAPKFQNDCPIHQRIGQLADAGKGLGPPGVELGRREILALRAYDIGAVPGMSAVKESAQLLVIVYESICLVYQERRAPGVDGAKQRRR